MAINFNSEPYYDDFDENSKFYRILYRPGYAVQARELTQMQSILQNQITKFGNHVFKEGAMVIPGESGVDTNVGYIKLDSSYNSVLTDTVISNYVGKTITNSVAGSGLDGLRALVLQYNKSDGTDPATLFVRYKNSGDTSVQKVFSAGDILRIEDDATISQIKVATTAATGMASLATIKQGVYYLKGNFVLVEEQTVILDKYGDTPSYRIGLVTKETIITPEDDDTLFDNAQNTYNYAAPGAHRYYIEATLTKIDIDSTDDIDFIELVRVENGKIKRLVTKTDYSLLEDTLARRTYDESGNYTVSDFTIDVREYRNNNRGAWAAGRYYLIGDVVTNGGNTYVAKTEGGSVSVAPVHTTGLAYDGPGNTGIQWEYNPFPYYNRGIFSPANTDDLTANKTMESKLAVGLEPGKAYVQGYEINKIATEYVTINKSRQVVQVDNANIPTTVGNYILVTNVNNLPPIDTFATVTLYDRLTSAVGTAPAGATAVGTARIRFIEWHNGTIGTQTAVYKIGLFDVQMVNNADFSEKVKSVFYDRLDTNLNFSADISPILQRLSGNLTSYTSNTYGTQGSGTYIKGTQTSFQTELQVGDYINISGSYRRVTSIDSQYTIQIDSAVNVTGVTYDELLTTLNEPNNVSLLFQIPQYAVKSVRSASLTNDTIYTVYEKLSGTATTSATPTLTVTTASGSMASAAGTTNYIVVDNDATAGGAIVSPTSITPSGSSVTFGLPATYSGRNMTVIAANNKSGSILTEKTKTLVSYATIQFNTQSAAQASSLLLGHADGYRLISVKMKSGTWASPGATYSIDITDRYEFDNGQRDTHYDVARINLKNSYAPPEAPIEVTFDYFSHSTGDYFTVNSYPSDVPYSQIPYYLGLPLRDAIDFRPRMADSGSVFSGTGASVSLIPKRGIDITADYTYYLSRKTKIALDFQGNFNAIDGVSSVLPPDPLDPSLGMVLYNLTLEPYTFGTASNNVIVTKNDNKRYTMRDIGKLEKRIDNLEYYTSLSLLEQQTESLQITDANGLDRYKNGFIVDGFTGHNTGDPYNPDYMCAIDMENAQLRPFFSMQNLGLIEKNSNDTQRTASNYKLYGDVITLPVVDHVPIITQGFASRLENINPFAVFTFLGDIKLNPSSDDWFEIDRRPDLIIDVEGNYATIKSLAEKAGVLGTIWNAWQTQWTGTSFSTRGTYYNSDATGTKTLNAGGIDISFNLGNQGAPRRTVTVEVTATQVSQTRTGIRSTVVQKIDKQVVGDKILQTAVIPYIRSRNVLVQVKKLKPGTRFYPFFDSIDISSYVTPASKIVYTPVSGSFDYELNVGGLSTETARRINDDAQMCLNTGDVIVGQTSAATAVVVGKEYNPDTNQYALYVMNIIGTFAVNETILGSLTAANGKVVSVTTKTQGSSVISNFNGDIQLLFNIPNSDSMRFRCGTREFKLVDVPAADGDFTSRARANYSATGILETRQRTVNSVRNAELVQEQVKDTQTIWQTASRTVSDTGWWDPLAQSFKIDVSGGCFLSKIDVFFATKDSKIPVTLEIRECVNGVPGSTVLPFSRVTLKPEQVNLSANTVDLDGVTVNSYDTPTTFNFPSPVYVQENGEYAIVLASDSNAYKVWISQTKDIIPGTARYISSQPYLGSLFKSQNASTWTPNQDQDLKFTVYRCQFDTSAVSALQYVNSVIPLQSLATDPFEIRSGVTTVRVWQPNHGFPANSKVTISGVSGTVCGIPAAELNGSHTISNVDLDSYTFTVTTSPTSSGYGGGTNIRATRNYQYDAIQPSVQLQSFPQTTTTFNVKTLSGKSVDSTTQTAYVADTDFTGVLINETNFFNTPRMIASEENETAFNSGFKSLTFNVAMSTSSDSLSPVIDTHRTSIILINNKVNNPSETNMNVASLDYTTILSANTNIGFSGYTITSSNAAAKTALASLTVGKYITVSGAANANNNGTWLVTAIAADGSSVTTNHSFTTEVAGSAVTIYERERFVDESAPYESSTHSKYVTRVINLANPSNYLRVRFALNLPTDSSVEVWYRVNVVGSTTPIELVSYTQIAADNTIPYANNSSGQFYDISYSKDGIQSFDALQIKLVMKSNNSSAVPLIKDFRVIACA